MSDEWLDGYCAGIDDKDSELRKQIATLQAENVKFRAALIQLRDCDWVITLPDRMDAVRDIARNALRAADYSVGEQD